MAHSVGRNDPCPCGSGKKYKKCCIDKEPLIDSIPRLPEILPAAMDSKPSYHLGEPGHIPYATEEYIRQNPDSAVAKMELLARQADAEMIEGRLEKAYDILREVQKMAEDDGMARTVLDDLQDLCQNDPAMRQRGLDVVSELEILNLKMGDRPQAAFAAVDRADLLEDDQRPEEALEQYRKALREYPECPWVQIRYGRFLDARGDSEGARRAFQEAVSLPDDHGSQEEARLELSEMDKPRKRQRNAPGSAGGRSPA